jgi:hypothetical protein
VFVFGGIAQVAQVHVGLQHHTDASNSHGIGTGFRSTATIDRPTRLKDMLTATERMGAGLDHLRVDLSEVEGSLWFGETCLYPGSGMDRFAPVEIDETLGTMWSEAYTCRLE